MEELERIELEKIYKQGYGFYWAGKGKCIKEAENIEKTYIPFYNENLYIEGDNLKALKMLQKEYSGKIKMIYIDPPYNTGKNFIYKDNYKKSNKNSLSIGDKKHSSWLNMMYPRVKLAKELLSEDGVIFISMNDNEVAQLKLLCDELFGEKNYIENFCWNKVTTPSSLSSVSRSDIDYILVYQKSSRSKQFYSNKRNIKETDSPVENKDNSISELLLKEGWVECKLVDGIYEKEKYGKGKLLDNLIVKNRKNINNFRLKSNFKWSQNYLEKEIDKGTKLLIKSDKISLRYLKNESRRKLMPPNKLINMKFGVGTTDNAKAEIKKLGIDFSYPKPVSLIKYLLNFIKYENSIILDFFSGSATTAHAVMELNAEDGGERKYIMVQLPELCNEKTEAYKAGYKTICDIGKERIRRAGEQIKLNNSLNIEYRKKLNTNFKVIEI